MASLDDVVKAIEELGRATERSGDLLAEIRDLLKQQGQALGTGGVVGGFGGGPGGGGGAPGSPGGTAAASQAIASGASGGLGAVGSAGGRLGQVAEFSSNVAREVSNPLRTTTGIGLDLLEAGTSGLAGAVGNAVAGPAGGRVLQNVAGAGLNAAGLIEERFVLNSAKRDVFGTLSSLTDQGLTVGPTIAKEIAGAARERARRQFEALETGANALGFSLSGDGGGGDSAAAKKLDTTNAELRKIAENTSRGGSSGRPVAGTTGE